MSSYMAEYTNMAEKIITMENKIHQLEKRWHGKNELWNHSCFFHFVSCLLNIIQNLKEDIMCKPVYCDKKVAQMYDKVCTLESELYKIMHLKGRSQNICAKGVDCISIPNLLQMYNKQNLPLKYCNDCLEDFPYPYSIKYRVLQNKSKKCIPHEFFFEKIPSECLSKSTISSYESFDESSYRILESTTSSSSTSIFSEDSNWMKKDVHSRRPKSVIFEVRKSKRKPTIQKRKKSKPWFSRSQQKIQTSKFSIWKQPKKKIIKKKHKPQRKRHSSKFDIKKSKSHKIKIYSDNMQNQNREISFTQRKYPNDKLGATKIENYMVTHLKKINSSHNNSSRRINKGNNGSKNKPSNRKPTKLIAVKYKDRKDLEERKSKSSVESQFIKNKFRKNPHKPGYKFKKQSQSNKKQNSRTLIMANNSSNISRTPSLHNKPCHYDYLVKNYSSSTSSFGEMSDNGQPLSSNTNSTYKHYRPTGRKTLVTKSDSNDGLILLTNSDICFTNNYEVVDSFCPVGSRSMPKGNHFKSLPQTHRPNYVHKIPTTVYTVTNELSPKKYSFHNVYQDGLAFNSKRKFNSTGGFSMSKRQINNGKWNKNVILNLEQENKSLPKVIINKYPNHSNSFIQNKEDRDLFSKNKLPIYKNHNTFENNIGKSPIKQSIYFTTVPADKNNFKKTSVFPNISQQMITNSQQLDMNVPENIPQSKEIFSYPGSVSKEQVKMLTNKSNQVLTDTISGNLKQNSKLQLKAESEYYKKPSKEKGITIYQVQMENTGNPLVDKNKVKDKFSLTRLSSKSKDSVKDSSNSLVDKNKVKSKFSLTRLWSKAKNSAKDSGNSLVDKNKVKSKFSLTKLFSKSKDFSAKDSVKQSITENKKSFTLLASNEDHISSRNKSLNATSKTSENNLQSNLLNGNIKSKTQLKKKSTSEKVGEKKSLLNIKRSLQSFGGSLGKLLRGKKSKSKDILLKDKKDGKISKSEFGSSEVTTKKTVEKILGSKQLSHETDVIFDQKMPRSVSGYNDEHEKLRPTDSESSFLSKKPHSEIDSGFDKFSFQEKTLPLKKRPTRQHVPKHRNGVKDDKYRVVEHESTIKHHGFFDQTHKPLNYSLRFSKEKHRHVEMDTIPNTLSLGDILPPNCKKLLSMEEITFSDHKFNGIEEHGRMHEIFIRPHTHQNKKVRETKLCQLCEKRDKKQSIDVKSKKAFKKFNDHPNLNVNKYYKNIPITSSVQIFSDSSSCVDWKQIVDGIKESY